MEERETVIKKSRPISLKGYSEDGRYFVENINLSLFGEGETLREAVRDFIKHFIYFYHYYNNLNKNSLMGEGIKLKEIYKTLFR